MVAGTGFDLRPLDLRLRPRNPEPRYKVARSRLHTPSTPDAKLADLVDEWLQRLRAEGRLKGTTINEYERVLRILVVPGLGDTSLLELTTEQINALLTGFGQHSIDRQRKAKVILGAMLDAAVADGALRNNPARGTLSISRPPASQVTLSRAEIAQVHPAVRNWLCKDRPGPKSSGDMAAIIELMLATGARIGEVLALLWRNINLGREHPRDQRHRQDRAG